MSRSMYVQFSDFQERSALSIFVSTLKKDRLISIETRLVNGNGADILPFEVYRVWFYHV